MKKKSNQKNQIKNFQKKKRKRKKNGQVPHLGDRKVILFALVHAHEDVNHLGKLFLKEVALHGLGHEADRLHNRKSQLFTCKPKLG